jgi:hypothetical protein
VLCLKGLSVMHNRVLSGGVRGVTHLSSSPTLPLTLRGMWSTY